MRPMQKYISTTLIGLSMFFSMSPSLHAHLMVAQHGTLNFLDNNIFMVMSLPISAFEDIDDDMNGEISMIEFNNHRAKISITIKQNVLLSDNDKILPLQGLMLSPVISHSSVNEPIKHLTITGKYTLIHQNSNLNFDVRLFGKQVAEQVLKITATHKANNKKHVFELTPKAKASIVFE